MNKRDTAIVLLAHGSRDPLWSKPIEQVAKRIHELDSSVWVACAYLEFNEPNLDDAISFLIAQNARQIKVLPMFLGAGRHVREDLPRLFQMIEQKHLQNRSDLIFEWCSPIGENPAIIEALAFAALN